MNKKYIDYRVYLITNRELLGNKNLEEVLEEALKGGATLIQLREKKCSSLEFYKISVEIKKLTDKYNVPLIINDRLDIAMAINAAGVHIGQNDIPVAVARKILGEDKIIGVSAQTLEQAQKAEKEGADYLGVGAIFKTSTKKDANQGIGLETLRNIKNKVNIPIVGIGGISHKNLSDIISTGADGAAIISCILSKDDVKRATKSFKELW